MRRSSVSVFIRVDSGDSCCGSRFPVCPFHERSVFLADGLVQQTGEAMVEVAGDDQLHDIGPVAVAAANVAEATGPRSVSRGNVAMQQRVPPVADAVSFAGQFEVAREHRR